ncbi:growth factor receptor-bound protein [Holotrichia oblita]|uniref:Growth factor receptor-bound protein n=1 Tax=Holotrichia oblita TaxID=644536 RepID=A0ACB9TC71_HOLOL|nr:growth factor receptor-bound protein [Holotrichia oblita]
MLVDELAQEDLDILAHARSCSISSIAVQSNAATPVQSYNTSEGYSTPNETYSAPSEISVGRHSRASSSSSSGCMSDGASSTCENAFDSEFSTGTIKRKPSMKPSLPLTSTTRQLKEVGETRDENDNTSIAGSPVTTYTSTGTLTKKHHRRKSNNSGDDSSNCSTLKRQHSYKNRGSVESMGSCSGNSTPLGNTPVREHAAAIAESVALFSERVKTPMNNEEEISMTDSIISLPPPPDTTEDNIVTSPTYQLPPPPQELFNSNLSLDSLPPPPNLNDLPSISESELTGSQLSLMSLPPPPPSETGAVRKRLGSTTPTNSDNSPDRTPVQSNVNTPTYHNPPNYYHNQQSSTLPCCSNNYSARSAVKDQSNSNIAINTNSTGGNSANSATLPYPGGNIAARSAIQSLNLQQVTHYGEPQSPKKLVKKISFNLAPQETPALPKKPLPPKRSDSTRLSSPRKLTDPPTEFLKDLQRVMRKKWQVAQKCKEEPSTTPYEVLGFRDPPAMLPDYKETNVSNWVKEHYGPNNLYENVYRDTPDGVVEYATSPVHTARNESKIYDFIRCKRPPPPPPKRSELTHLSTTKSH